MSDQTVYAEALIATISRAFYDDEVVCLIDVLLRDKFLRDDDMGPRLSLPAKQLRRTMQFLQEELLVKYELVDDLSSGGSQATRFWYIDYNHAVNVIRLRIYKLKKKLEEAELRARSSSMYLCPGYKKKVCNGRYTETEAQQIVDYDDTGLFLCQECVTMHVNNPEPPLKSTYTLQLVDNTKDLKLAMDNMRRVSAQLSAKMNGNYQLRPGIYDLLQKVRAKGQGPLSNNLPSENRALGVGSKRLAGTGRTAGIKAKKLAQQAGINVSNASSSKVIHRILTMGENDGLSLLGKDNETELNFLKNARGEEIAFEVEKGGGARANLLATRNRRKSKLMDAAATRVGVININLLNNNKKRNRDTTNNDTDENATENSKKNKQDQNALPGAPEFLMKNIDFSDIGYVSDSDIKNNNDQDENESDNESDDEEKERSKLLDENNNFISCNTPEERQRAFQLLYKMEIARQNSLLFGIQGSDSAIDPGTINTSNGVSVGSSGIIDHKDDDIHWEDG